MACVGRHVALVWAHWNSVNGRMSDIMHYFFLGALPRWSNALINACSVGGMFWLAVMLVRMAGGGFGRMKAVALVVPWRLCCLGGILRCVMRW